MLKIAATEGKWGETKRFGGEEALGSKNTVKNKTNTLLDQFLALLGKFYTKIKFLNYVHKCLEFFLKEDNRKFNYDACAI